MSIKKIAITGAAAALMLASVVPAFASRGHKGVSINNDASVENNVNTSSNTGNNTIRGWGNGGGRHQGGVSNSNIDTGNATSYSTVRNDINSNRVSCGCDNRHGLRLSNEADVSNNVNTSSNTGNNTISGGKVRNSDIGTGNAYSDGLVTNVVNTNVVGGVD